jgi:uncharacterized membrane protein YbhN (UPF0104 family)
LRTWLKLAVSIAILAFIASKVDLRDMGRRIAGLDPVFVIAAFAVYLAGQVASALRYVYVLQALRRSLPLGASLRVHYIGLWFNQVMPTSLGGDVAKVYYLRGHVGTSRAIRATLLDRISGLAILLITVLALAPVYLLRFPVVAMPAIALSAVLVLAMAIAPLVAGHPALRRLMPRIAHPAILLASDIGRFRRWQYLVQQLWSSGVVHACGICTYAMLGMALGVQLTLLDYVLLVPLVFLVALLPFSFAGWGLRETGAVGLFGLAAIPAEASLLLSVLFGLLQLISSIPGGFDWAFNRGHYFDEKSSRNHNQ